MGTRDVHTTARDKAKAANEQKKQKANVFDTHGNEAIQAHIAETRKSAAQPEAGSILDASAQAAAELAVDPASRRAALDQVSMLMLKLQESPAQLAEIAGSADSHEDQTLALLDYMGTQLDNATAATLASMSTDEIAFDLGNLVISTPALQAPDQGEEIVKLGALAPVLYDLIMASLEQADPVLEEAGLDEASPDTTNLMVALAETDQLLQFL